MRAVPPEGDRQPGSPTLTAVPSTSSAATYTMCRPVEGESFPRSGDGKAGLFKGLSDGAALPLACEKTDNPGEAGLKCHRCPYPTSGQLSLSCSTLTSLGAVPTLTCQHWPVQIIEVSIAGVRSAIITLKRSDTPMQIVLFPVIHLGTPDFYKAVTSRLRGCQLVVAEGIQGKSATASVLALSYRLLRRNRRLAWSCRT